MAKSLIKPGLVSDEHASSYTARDAWQTDGRTRLLCITHAGLRAIGLAPEVEEAKPEDTRPRDERNGLNRRLVDGDDEPAAPGTVGDTAPTGAEDAGAQDTPAAPDEPAQSAPLAEGAACWTRPSRRHARRHTAPARCGRADPGRLG